MNSRNRFKSHKPKFKPAKHSARHGAPAPKGHTTHHAGQAPSGKAEFVEGILQLKGRSGFVLSEDEKQSDVLVQGFSLKLARDGDRVRVKLGAPTADRRTGKIVEVLVRARKTAVGQFKLIAGAPFLVPEQEEFRLKLDLKGRTPKVDDLIVADITQWPTDSGDALGNLTEILGPPQSNGMDLLTVTRRHELPDSFPAEVQSQAASYGTEVPPENLRGRKLFFDESVVTIDGEDAADFDDAISIRSKIEGGWTLAVHIADVSHYVTEGSPLDKEAFARGTSVYFPGHVVPMLPHSLSSNLCSLRPDVVRLTLSCVMELSAAGDVVSCQMMESAIRSARRFTYNEVEALLNGKEVANVTPRLLLDVKEMDRLARLIRAQRVKRGSLDFDFPEANMIMDPHGRPLDIQKRERLESHRLIEDFMVLANESVAKFMSTGPFIYRVHEGPDNVKLEKLRKTLDSLGLSLPKGVERIEPKVLQRVLDQIDKKPIQPIVQMMILRSLKQAIYSPINKGHFGLASQCYSHFTSPIRRYPDLIVHRLLRERLRNEMSPERKTHWGKELNAISLHASKRERVAVEAEREFVALQKVRFMANRVGETFSGVITGLAAFGFFVQLDQVFVEGMVPVATIEDDFYIFDEVRVRLFGRRTGKTFFMGQKVEVKLLMANPVKRQLEFQLIGVEGKALPVRTEGKKPAHAGHHRGRGGSGGPSRNKHRRR